jgi:uncharacterized protein with beta-barrel porin domain
MSSPPVWIVDGGTFGGTINVGSGRTLGGSGTVGTTIVGDSGCIMPGNSIGTLTVDGDLTFEEGSLFEAEITPRVKTI